MDFKYIFNSAAGKVGGFTKAAVRKTGEAAEVAKLRVAFASEKRKLEGMFSTLGKLFYEQVKGTDIRVQIAAQVMEIDEQKAVLAELKSAIVSAKGKTYCQSCQSPISAELAYCPSCGAQQFATKSGSDGETASQKPLSTEDFVSVFKDTTAKYF